MGAPNSSGPVAQVVEEGGEERKEPEAFEKGDGGSRSSGCVRSVVDGASAAAVISGSNDVREDATTVAGGSGELGVGSLGTDKFSSGSLGAVNMNRTGYRLKGIVVSYTCGGVLLKGARFLPRFISKVKAGGNDPFVRKSRSFMKVHLYCVYLDTNYTQRDNAQVDFYATRG